MTKMKRLLTCFCLFASALVSAAPMPSMPGDYNQVLRLSNGQSYGYGLHLPKNADKRKKMPLVVALHYSFQGNEAPLGYGFEFMQWMMSPTFDNAIIIAPSAIDKAWHSQKNTDALFELMAHIKANYSIKDKRTLLTGYSAGGFGTWAIGALHQENFGALLPMSGAPKLWQEPAVWPQTPEQILSMMRAMPTVDAQWQIPVFAIHSNADQNVPMVLTSDYLSSQQANGNADNITLVTIDGAAHFDIAPFLAQAKAAYTQINQIWDAY